MFWISKQDFDRAIRGIHYHLNRIENNMATQAELDDLKASADAAVADLSALRAAVASVQAALDAAIAAGNDSAAIKAVADELKAAVAIDAPPAPPAAPPA